MKLIKAQKGDILFLLGNEAIVRGALEAGLHVATTYPGTPASEIGDSFYEISKHWPVYFEYSVNEKVALEVAAGAALTGAKALSSMKHVGVNVAADAFITLVYAGVQGGLILITADDPGCHSSQNEQDNRYYARLAKAPLLEPSTPQEAYFMARDGLNISHQFQIPLILRTTTRVSHLRGPVTVGQLNQPQAPETFVKAPLKYVNVPAISKTRHPVVEETILNLKEYAETSPYNFISGNGTLGIITSGASYLYVKDVISEFNLGDSIKVLKLGFTHPIPDKIILNFLKSVNKVLIVEELEPYLEEAVQRIAWKNTLDIQILGKEQGILPLIGEFNPDIIKQAVGEFSGSKIKISSYTPEEKMPARPPVMCPGCPHRATFYAAKTITGGNAIYPMDIGCYALAVSPPYNMADYLICMGISISGGGGSAIAAGKKQPVVSFIGDSTFFHSGITGLINAVHNNQKFTLIILDNLTTAMTGHQPHPGTEKDTSLTQINMEELVKSIGVKWVKTVDPYNLKESIAAMKEALAFNGVSVIISKAPCVFVWNQEQKKAYGKKYYEVRADRCSICWLAEDQCTVAGTPEVNINRAVSRLFDENKNDHVSLKPNCSLACPANVCVHGYISRLKAGDFDGAVEIIREQNPLVSICGYVCTHPCEEACILGEQGKDPVKIRELKRLAAINAPGFSDSLHLKQHIEKSGKRGKNIAVIGSGPAGLSAGYELIRRGYEVTIYEKEKIAGGLLYWAIPEYRLPKDALQKEINFLKEMGIKIKTDSEIGKNISWKELNQKHDAVILCSGASIGIKLELDGEDSSGVYDALGFLWKVNSGEINNSDETQKILGSKIGIIGGGDAAIDAARSAKKLNPAAEVTIYYRRDKQQMPARLAELNEALHEGINLKVLTNPLKLNIENGKLNSVEFIKMELSNEKDRSGRPKPQPVKGSEFVEKINTLIVAIGQKTLLSWVDDENIQNQLKENGILKVNEQTGQSIVNNIFAAGDVVTGPATVIEAVKSGRIAAYGVDRLFRNKEAPSARVAEDKVTKYNSSKPVENPISFDDIKKESQLCVVCGTCAACRNCVQNFACPAMSIVDGRVYIDPEICTGCGVCAQLCPNGAIEARERG